MDKGISETSPRERELTDAAAAARRAYYRAWRDRNPDKVRERNRRYWEKKGEKKLLGESRW